MKRFKMLWLKLRSYKSSDHMESECVKGLFCLLIAGSVGRNLANKPNVYVSSSAGAQWREVSAKFENNKNSGDS